MRRTIDHLFYLITTLCNGKCKFCNNWKIIDANKETLHLSLDEINRITKKIGKLMTLSFTGGEPFLREDIVDICRLFYINTNFKALSIPTNALSPEKISESVGQIVSYCRRSFIVIELPLDGVYAKYDDIRGFKGAFNKLKETFSKLEAIKRQCSNLHIKFNITYSYYNRDYIKEILNSAKSIFGKIDFTLGLIRGEPRHKEAKQIDIQDYFNILKEVYGPYDGNIKSLLYKSIRRITNNEFQKRLLKKRPSIKCLSGKKFVILSYDGEVLPCEPFSKISLGNLRDFDFDLSKLLSNAYTNNNLLSTLGRKGCICDWSCGISRSMWSSKVFFLRLASQLAKELSVNIKNKFLFRQT